MSDTGSDMDEGCWISVFIDDFEDNPKGVGKGFGCLYKLNGKQIHFEVVDYSDFDEVKQIVTEWVEKYIINNNINKQLLNTILESEVTEITNININDVDNINIYSLSNDYIKERYFIYYDSMYEKEKYTSILEEENVENIKSELDRYYGFVCSEDNLNSVLYSVFSEYTNKSEREIKSLLASRFI